MQKVSEIRTSGERIEILFSHSSKRYEYGRDRVRILRNPKRYVLREGEWVEANGNIWESATEFFAFAGYGDTWSRIFYRKQAGEDYSTYPASQVRVITSAAENPAAAGVLRYWSAVVSAFLATIRWCPGMKNSLSFTPRVRSAPS